MSKCRTVRCGESLKSAVAASERGAKNEPAGYSQPQRRATYTYQHNYREVEDGDAAA
ncbi:hypothetical protein ACJ73_10228, partial [Blastomyces percursus]